MSKYIGTPVVNVSVDTVDVTGDITTTDTTPEVIIVNNTHEDTDGGREGKVTFKGQQSGGEETTLAQIQASHDGTSDDEKGDLIFKTNDGSDGASPTERLRIDSAGQVGIGNSSPNTRLYVETGSNNSDIARFTGDQTTKGLLISTFSSGGNDGGVTLSANNKLGLKTGSETALTVDSSQNVGIGTTSPATQLHVSSGTSGDCVLRLEADTDNNDEGDTPSILFAQDGGVTLNRIGVEGISGTTFTNSLGNNLYLLAGGTALGIDFATNGAARGRFDENGVFYVGKTSTSRTTVGFEARGTGFVRATADGDKSLELVRKSSDGEMFEFFRDSTLRGEMGVFSDRVYLSVPGHGISLDASGNSVLPSTDSGNNNDNFVDIGASSARFDDVHATNGTIQTSDEREKQQIASLTDAEIIAAKAISKLFKTFKWNDRVETKGDNARTHTGVIAQQVETAMSDAGLDAGNYAFFISTTWWETETEVAAVEGIEAQDAVYDDDGNLVQERIEGRDAKDAYTEIMTYYTQEAAPEGATERNRKGIRYPELLSFIGAATEQRLTSIEARLDALEGE